MKKILLAATAALMCLGATAQTNFREISFNEAVAAAKAEQKLVFIDFKTVWCGPCKMMARETFPDKSVGNFMNQRFVSIMIDAEKGEGVELAKTYDVHAYPTFVIVDADKKEVTRTVGYKDAGTFLAELERLLDPNATPEKLKARYEGGERTADVVKKYAGILMEEARGDRRTYQQKVDEVNQMVQDYFSSLSDAQKLAPENMFVYTTYTPKTSSASAQYMTHNLSKFTAEQQEELLKIIEKLYRSDEYALLSGEGTAENGAIATFKSEVDRLGLNASGRYDMSAKLMEAWNGDGSQYMQLCKSLFPKLDMYQQSGVMGGLVSKFKDSDEAIKKQASRIIREQLADMDVQLLYTGIMNIMQLENGH